MALKLKIRLATITLVVVTHVSGQQNGRFASLKNQAFELFDRGQFEQVAGKLEEIWEQDHSDPKVAEFLAMGYIYGEHNVDKARPIMKEAISQGGQATFLVQHSHEKLALLNGDTINNYCSGRMSIVPGKMTFIAESGDHSVTFAAADLKGFRVPGGSPGRVEMKSGGKTYVFRVKSETRKEADLFEEVASQNLGKK